LTEVVLPLQFEPLEGMKTPHLGLLWRQFRDRFPMLEEHPPLPPVFEKFDKPAPGRLEIVVEEKPPVPRVWFLDEKGMELVQVQPDRFIHNWRKVTEQDVYCRYETIRESFRGEVDTLASFVKHERIGELRVNQCEVTYVNHVQGTPQWPAFAAGGGLQGLVRVACGLFSAASRRGGLPKPVCDTR